MPLQRAKIARHQTIHPTLTKAMEFRGRYATVNSEMLRGVKVHYPVSLAQFDACQYVLCTDATRGVVRTATGSIAAYRDGEFAGWHPSIEIAVEVCRSPFR